RAWREVEIDAERLSAGEAPRRLELPRELGKAEAAGGEETESAGVDDGGYVACVGEPHQTAGDDRVADLEQIGHPGSEGLLPHEVSSAGRDDQRIEGQDALTGGKHPNRIEVDAGDALGLRGGKDGDPGEEGGECLYVAAGGAANPVQDPS